MRRQRNGFTLIELLVVIAIIAVLAAIIFPVYSSARRHAQTSACLNNERQIGLAYRAYMEDFNGRYMPAAQVCGYSHVHNLYYGRYVRTLNIFMCPAAPHDTNHVWTWAGNHPPKDSIKDTQALQDATDCTWTWTEADSSTSHGNYGLNVFLGGMNPDMVGNSSGKDLWSVPIHVPTEGEVAQSSKVALLTDSRWVDLGGCWNAGRIGLARERHFNGANVLCCDLHVKFSPEKYLNSNPVPPGGGVRWDYRY